MNQLTSPTFRLPGLEKLAELKSFDPTVFLSEDKMEQEVCNLVLSLAVVYNDLKDLIWVHYHLGKARPKADEKITRYMGEYSGLNLHARRLIFSALHELVVLITNNKRSIDHKLFQRCVQQIPTRARDSWNALVSFACGEKSEHFAKGVFDAVRNKVAFHYDDTKAINLGFRLRFTNEFIPNTDKIPYVSSGRTTQESRFYFADALIQAYIDKKISADNSNSFDKEFMECLSNTNNSLHLLVEHFIYVRKGSFRVEKEQFVQ